MPETTLSKITEHFYWMSPGKPDRPSLGAVVGSGHTLMLDAAASAAHARLFLEALRAENVRPPRYVALTHWHWDHIFGAAELGLPLIAHTETAAQIARQAQYEWSDVALDERVRTGTEIAFCADNIKLELPEPRIVEIVQPDIVFEGTLIFNLGAVTCRIEHVGGDHAGDSCVMFIEPDRVLFLGDCLYDAIYAPARHYTVERLLPLLDKVLAFDADYFIEGHSDTVMTRDDIEAMAQKMRRAGRLVERLGTDEAAVLAALESELGEAADEDSIEFVGSFIAGVKLG